MIDRGESPRDSQEPGRESGHHSIFTRGTLVIDVEACKGCELCIDACPPGVLEMGNEFNLRGYRYPWLRPGCTGCKACSQICPDFVFQVYKYEVPRDLPVNPRTSGADS